MTSIVAVSLIASKCLMKMLIFPISVRIKVSKKVRMKMKRRSPEVERGVGHVRGAVFVRLHDDCEAVEVRGEQRGEVGD